MKNATRLFFQMRDNRFVTMENVMHNRFDDENFGLFEMCKEDEKGVCRGTMHKLDIRKY